MSLPAHAQPPPSRRERPLAESLHGPAKNAYTAASMLYKQGVFAEAEAKYSEAYDLSKDPRLVFDMATCEKEMHHYARMGALLRQYEEEAGANISAEDRTMVDGALAALPKYIGAVALDVDPAGTTVTVDGEAIGTAPLPAPVVLDPGKHIIGARKDGFETVERPISVSAGNSTTLTIALLAEGAQELKAAKRAAPPAAEVAAPPAAPGRRWGPLVFLGLGVAGAGLVVGSVTGVLVLAKASSLSGNCQGKACPSTANDDLQAGRALATVSTVSFAVAGVGAVAGVVALLLAPRREETSKTAGSIEPWVGPESVGVRGSF